MDTITHALAGCLAARALPVGRWGDEAKPAKIALVAGSVLPDADIVPSLLGRVFFIQLHHGLSHSLFGAAASSFLLACLLYRFGRWKSLGKSYALLFSAQLIHIALDLLNSFGLQIFQPFSAMRISFDLVYVVDPAVTGIILAGLVLSRYRPLPVRLAWLVLGVYVGFVLVVHERVEAAVKEAATAQGIKVRQAYALPMPIAWSMSAGTRFLPLPVGPLAWNGFVDDGETYLRAEVDPFSKAVRWKERDVRGGDTQVARDLLRMPAVRAFLTYARFPVVRRLPGEWGSEVVLSDLRFGDALIRHPLLLRVVASSCGTRTVAWGRGAGSNTRGECERRIN